jgi:hypothetical protein
MWMESDSHYFSRRAWQEREAATKALHPAARDAHLAMARRFEEVSRAIEKNERLWRPSVDAEQRLWTN